MINVVKPYLPDRKNFNHYLNRIYDSNILTNNGPLAEELRLRLESYLKVKNLCLVSNGTVALDLGLKLLNKKTTQNVFSTPFTFIATSSVVKWNGGSVCYGDIDSNSFNLSPVSLKSASKSDVLLPVHVFGNPCSSDIDEYAIGENKKLLFDAAHAFGVEQNSNSVLSRGDISTLSFHATKLFHTGEGGALVIKSDDLYEEAKSKINFGFKNGGIESVGVNFKMSEYHAAVGLAVLDEIHIINEQREEIYSSYTNALNDLFQLQKIDADVKQNYSYFPIICKSESQLINIIRDLNSEGVNPRRYFYPSLNLLSKGDSCPNSESLSSRVLCLPIYPGLKKSEQLLIINTIRKSINA